MNTLDMTQSMLKATYLLVLAGILLFINMRTFRSAFAKKLTYYGMWSAIVASVAVAVSAFL